MSGDWEHKERNYPCALVGVHTQRQQDAAAEKANPAPCTPAVEQQPHDRSPNQRHKDRLNAHPTEVYVPAHTRQRACGKEWEGRRQPHCAIKFPQFDCQASHRCDAANPGDRRSYAHGRWACLPAKLLKERKHDGICIGIQGGDTKVARQK